MLCNFQCVDDTTHEWDELLDAKKNLKKSKKLMMTIVIKNWSKHYFYKCKHFTFNPCYNQ